MYIFLAIYYIFVIFTFTEISGYCAEKFKEMQKDVIFRNGYHTLRSIYLINSHIELDESDKEKKERSKFEKGRPMIFGIQELRKTYPMWGSWNYGLDIGSDNNPEEKDKADGSDSEAPTDLADP